MSHLCLLMMLVSPLSCKCPCWSHVHLPTSKFLLCSLQLLSPPCASRAFVWKWAGCKMNREELTKKTRHRATQGFVLEVKPRKTPIYTRMPRNVKPPGSFTWSLSSSPIKIIKKVQVFPFSVKDEAQNMTIEIFLWSGIPNWKKGAFDHLELFYKLFK